MKSYFKKFMALMLAVLMVASCLSTAVFAVDDVAPAHEHVWVEWAVVAPTCTTVGYTLEKCECGEVQEKAGSIVLPTGHADYVWDGAVYCCPACGDIAGWDDGITKHNYQFVGVTANPTCAVAGNAQFKCEGSADCDCSEENPTVIDVEIDKLDHTLESKGVVEIFVADIYVKDVNNAGKVIMQGDALYVPGADVCYVEAEHFACSSCNAEEYKFVAEYVHAWGEWVDDEECECIRHNSCEKCGLEDQEENHQKEGSYGYEVGGADPSDNYCTYEWSCVKCDCSKCEGTKEKVDHLDKGIDVLLPPTCKTWGIQVEFCKHCGWRNDATPVEPVAHAWEELDNEPATCTEDGFIKEVCLTCGDVRETVLPKLGHDWPEEGDEDYQTYYEDPTCVDDGRWHLVCRNGCGSEKVIIHEGTRGDNLHPWHVTVVDDKGIASEVPVLHITTKPDCLNNGVAAFTCSLCGKHDDKLTYEEVKAAEDAGNPYTIKSEELLALGHDFGEPVTVEATCVVKGATIRTCNRCFYEDKVEGDFDHENHKTGKNIKALEGKKVYVNGKTYFMTPTGEADGILYLECEDCHRYYVKKDDGSKLDGHLWGDPVLYADGKAPTCTEDGFEPSYVRYCTNKYYGSSYNKVVDEHGVVSYEWEIIEYTCNKIDTDNVKVIPARGHLLTGHFAKAPTCTEAGWTKGEKCLRCDYEVKSEPLAALGHDLVKIDAKDPTCEKAGNIEYHDCSRCEYLCVYKKDVEVEVTAADVVIPATGHNFVLSADSYCTEHFVASSCDLNGWWYGAICGNENCDGNKVYYVDENGNTISYSVIESDKACQHAYTAPIAEHSMVEGTIEADCLKPGITYWICNYCEDACDHYGVKDYVAPLDHEWVELDESYAEPTCTEPGKTGYVCAHCGEEDVVEVAPALGHDVADNHSSSNPTDTCARCGIEVDIHEGLWGELNVEDQYQILDSEDALYDKQHIKYDIYLYYCTHVDCNATYSEAVSADMENHFVATSDIDTLTYEIVNKCACGFEWREPMKNLVFTSDVHAAIEVKDENGIATDEIQLLDCGAVNTGLIAVQLNVSGNNVSFWGVEMALKYNSEVLSYEDELTKAYNSTYNTSMLFEFGDDENGTVSIVAAHTLNHKDPSDEDFMFTGSNVNFVTLVFRVNYDKYNTDVAFDIADGAIVLHADGSEVGNCEFNAPEGEVHIFQLGDVTKHGDGIGLTDSQALMEMVYSFADYEAVADVDQNGTNDFRDFLKLQAMIVDKANYDSWFAPAE